MAVSNELRLTVLDLSCQPPKEYGVVLDLDEVGNKAPAMAAEAVRRTVRCILERRREAASG